MKMRTAAHAVAMLASSAITLASFAADCDQTSVGLTPISELTEGLYLDVFEGGLYPNQSNLPPLAHHQQGLAAAAGVIPRGADGTPDPAGHYVLLSIGMSNTTQEFCSENPQGECAPYTFMGQAAAHPAVNQSSLVLIDGAAGGQTADKWDDPESPNYDRVRDDELTPLGLSEAQVQAVWIKVAHSAPTVSLPDANADAWTLLEDMGAIARAVKTRYPNVRVAFFSSRIYAGYADTPLNPEPYAYEAGFGVKWVIEAQINQMSGGGVDERAGDLAVGDAAPWIGWGPYLWADGLTPRADGLIWECGDFANDGTHPAPSGREKVGTLLLNFMLSSPYARGWFRTPPDADLNGDGSVDATDLALLLASWGPCPDCPEDLTGNDFVGPGDLSTLLAAWTE